MINDKDLSATRLIKSRISLSSIIQKVVELKGHGSSKIGLCPFHNEKTPSFHVRDHEGRFKCFGCGAAGDHFDFLIKLRGIEFSKALEELSELAGINLPQKPVAKETNEKKSLYNVLKLINQFFTFCLTKNTVAIDYLINNRGLNDKMITQASLGFCPKKSDVFLSFLKSKNISLQAARDLGLIKRNSNEPVFANRIIFPITDFNDNIIAFGGRTFLKEDEGLPKYLNSSISELYEKKSHFYGAKECKSALLQGKTPIIVEGYFDAMAFWAIGLPALALCGTSLSNEHAQILRKFTSNIVLCFDLDSAGIKALSGCLPILFTQNFKIDLILLDKKDPGAYLETVSLDSLRQKVLDTKDAFCFLIDFLSIKASDSINARLEQIDQLNPIFSSIQRDFLKRQYVYYLAKKIHEDPHMLWREIQRKINFKKKSKEKSEVRNYDDQINDFEKIILQTILPYSDLVDSIEEELLDSFSDSLKEVVSAIKAMPKNHDNIQEYVAECLHDYLNVSKYILELDLTKPNLTKEDAINFITSLNEKIKERFLKETLKTNLVNVKQAEKEGNYEDVFNNLREHSKLLSTKKNISPRLPNLQKPLVTFASEPKKIQNNITSKNNELAFEKKMKEYKEPIDFKSIFSDETDWI